MAKYGLKFVAQIHTCHYKGRPAASAKSDGVLDQGYVGSESVEEHIRSFEAMVQRCKRLGAVQVNSHSGHDGWSLEEGVAFLTAAVEIEKREGILVTHETHRRRLLWNPWQTKALIDRVPGFKINADLSHWCCACERIFDATTDARWPEILAAVAARCEMIHARVGFAQGPQVPHPAALEYSFEVESHEAWWAAIWDAQAARGKTETFVEPEFGAPPYQRLEAFTRRPEESLWEINNYMAGRLAWRFGERFPESGTTLSKAFGAALEDGNRRAVAEAETFKRRDGSPAPLRYCGSKGTEAVVEKALDVVAAAAVGGVETRSLALGAVLGAAGLAALIYLGGRVKDA